MTRRIRSNTGFTLIELLAAATIAAMVVAVAGAIFAQVRAAQQRADRQVALQQQASRAVHRIAEALRNARRPGGEREPQLIGESRQSRGLPNDRLLLDTISRESVRPGRPESDVRRVAFFRTEDTEGKRHALMRRVDPTRNPEPDRGGVVERIADHVVGLDVHYFDTGRWREEWPREADWPTAVRVRVITGMIESTDSNQASQGNRGRFMQASRIVRFPHWPSDSPGGASGPSGDETSEDSSGSESGGGSGGGNNDNRSRRSNGSYGGARF